MAESIHVKLPDGTVKEVPKGTTALDNEESEGRNASRHLSRRRPHSGRRHQAVLARRILSGHQSQSRYRARPVDRHLEMRVGEPISTAGYSARETEGLSTKVQKAVEDLYYHHR
jgi:hypothetical protein